MPDTIMRYNQTASRYPDDWTRQTSQKRVNHPARSWDRPANIDPEFVQWKIDILVREPRRSSASETKFSNLVSEWHDETDMHSSLLRVISHPAYLKIIAMGHIAIPMILREMKSGPGHWFPAIEALTVDLLEKGEEPAKECATSSEARAAWVRWGESKGYL